MTVELVCSDVDGTIVATVYPKTEITQRTLDAIKGVCDQGIKFIIASGRPLRTMLPVAEQLRYKGMMICLNGALVYDYQRKQVLYSISMTPTTAIDLISDCIRIFGSAVGFGIESGNTFLCDKKYYSLRQAYINHEYSLYEDPIQMAKAVDKAEKVIVIHERLTSAQLYPQLLDQFGDSEWRSKIHISLGHPRFIDISAAGISKGVALKTICQDLDIPPEKVISFGNMLNDTEMLQFAGRGIAVADAHPQLLDLADEITDSCSNDGVAMVLESLF
jgi:Cof subfamily protein (haloacid dehalogenase superfamily)